LEAEESEREGREAIAKAAADPRHDFIRDPVLAPMAAMMWNAEMTFPLILRRSVFIAICAYVEHLLRRWCAFLHVQWKLAEDPKTYEVNNEGKRGTQTLVRYLRDIAGLEIADYGNWPEWSKLDAYFAFRSSPVSARQHAREKTLRASMKSTALAPLAVGPRAIDVRHAARLAVTVAKRFIRSGNRFPERMTSIGTAQIVFARAANDLSGGAIDGCAGQEAFMRSGNDCPEDMKRSCHAAIDGRDDAKAFMRSGNDCPEDMKRSCHASILSCRDRDTFVAVATSIMRSGNDLPERMNRFAHAALGRVRGDVK
jgi:hypothetical protein